MMRGGNMVVLGAALTLAMSASAALDAVSDNYYSMLKVGSQAKTIPLAVPFVAIEAATNQHPISVAEAVDTRTLSEGDLLMIYDRAAGCFNEYEVTESGDWAAREVNTLFLSGEVRTATGGAASEMKVDPGYGSWLIRADTNNTVVLQGQLPYSATVEVAEGKNLVGPVKLSATDLNNCGTDWLAKGVKVTTGKRENGRLTYEFGDSIVFNPPGSAGLATLYFVKSGDAAPRWRSIGTVKTDAVIPAGCACWFIHAGEGFTYEMDPADVPEDAEPSAEQ